MKRRDFVKSLAIGTSCTAAGLLSSRIYAAPTVYDGQLLVVLQMDGGWDVTSLCDPKMNVAGEPEINHWASSADTRKAGNIRYAPVADNGSLFDKYYRDMLVINGVDAQTNSHTTGVLHNWSGKNASGLPTLTALFAAHRAPDVPLSYVNFGGFASTASLIRYSRLDDTNTLLDLLNPNTVPWEPERSFRSTAELQRVEDWQRRSLQRSLDSPTLTPMQRENINAYLSSRETQESLILLKDVLPPAADFKPDDDLGGALGTSNLKRQMQLSLLTFKSGIGCAADLILSGFDTHTTHDSQQDSLYRHFASALDYFWSYAGELGIAHRVTLVIGSDFGRTPVYNTDNGKDHWPIGSYIVMEQGANWGNRVVGLTDEGHNAYRINPSTLKRDDGKGTFIYPKHVHNALRRHLGIEGYGNAQGLGFSNAEEFDFFNPSKQT